MRAAADPRHDLIGPPIVRDQCNVGRCGPKRQPRRPIEHHGVAAADILHQRILKGR